MGILPETLAVLGCGAGAASVALREVLKFRTRAGSAIILDSTGRGATILGEENKASLDRRRIIWWDLADRRHPVAVFQLQRSAHLRDLLFRTLQRVRAISKATVADQTLAWATEAAYSLSADGSVGLAALLRCLARPETRRWFVETQAQPADLGNLLQMLVWALSFPSVHGMSEGPNRGALLETLSRSSVVWLETPIEHFEPQEHLLVQVLLEAAVDDALGSMISERKRWENTLRGLTVLHLYPIPGCSRDPDEWTGAHSSAIRHIGVHRLDSGRALHPLALSWATRAEFLWVVGPAGRLKERVHNGWLSPQETGRIESLGAGDLWLRANRTGKTVVSKVRNSTPVLGAAHRLRSRAAERRRISSIAQVAAAVRTLAPASGRRGLYERLCDPEMLRLGWLRVKETRTKSHGVDGLTISVFAESVDSELERLAEELKAGKYRGKPLRRVQIPKSSGGTRDLGIACIRDRIVQSACLALLEPIFEPTFSRYSFAFRPRRSAHQAVTMARALISAGRSWAVITDVRKCFDNVDHDVLLRLLARRIADEELLRLIQHWLTVDVLEFRDLLPTEIGIPQGESISPLLANVYLDPFDKHLERLGYAFVRYADDSAPRRRGEEAVM